MAKFVICYRMTCSGSIEVDASSFEEACRKTEETALSELGREAEDGEVEIVSEEEGE